MTDSRQELLFDLLEGKSASSVHLKEAIYNVDASQLFEEYCAEECGMKGLRLDLFYDDKSKNNKSTSSGK